MVPHLKSGLFGTCVWPINQRTNNKWEMGLLGVDNSFWAVWQKFDDQLLGVCVYAKRAKNKKPNWGKQTYGKGIPDIISMWWPSDIYNELIIYEVYGGCLAFGIFFFRFLYLPLNLVLLYLAQNQKASNMSCHKHITLNLWLNHSCCSTPEDVLKWVYIGGRIRNVHLYYNVSDMDVNMSKSSQPESDWKRERDRYR